MKKSISTLIAILVASPLFASEITFESVQKEFQQKVGSLASQEDLSVTDLQSKIAKFAEETLGSHPDVMRKETESRLKSLPHFPSTNMTDFVEHKSWDTSSLHSSEEGLMWLTFGWDPVKLAAAAKRMILAREIGPEGFGRLALLNAWCPDKVYRHGTGAVPDLVVDSLGDLFVVKVEMTEAGVCRPVSVRWLKRRGRFAARGPSSQ